MGTTVVVSVCFSVEVNVSHRFRVVCSSLSSRAKYLTDRLSQAWLARKGTPCRDIVKPISRERFVERIHIDRHFKL